MIYKQTKRKNSIKMNKYSLLFIIVVLNVAFCKKASLRTSMSMQKSLDIANGGDCKKTEPVPDPLPEPKQDCHENPWQSGCPGGNNSGCDSIWNDADWSVEKFEDIRGRHRECCMPHPEDWTCQDAMVAEFCFEYNEETYESNYSKPGCPGEEPNCKDAPDVKECREVFCGAAVGRANYFCRNLFQGIVYEPQEQVKQTCEENPYQDGCVGGRNECDEHFSNMKPDDEWNTIFENYKTCCKDHLDNWNCQNAFIEERCWGNDDSGADNYSLPGCPGEVPDCGLAGTDNKECADMFCESKKIQANNYCRNRAQGLEISAAVGANTSTTMLSFIKKTKKLLKSKKLAARLGKNKKNTKK